MPQGGKGVSGLEDEVEQGGRNGVAVDLACQGNPGPLAFQLGKNIWQRRISGIRGRRVFSEVCVRVPASDMGNSLFCAAVEPHEGLSFSAFVRLSAKAMPIRRRRGSRPPRPPRWPPAATSLSLKKQNCIVFAVGCGRAAYGYRSLSSTGGAKA